MTKKISSFSECTAPDKEEFVKKARFHRQKLARDRESARSKLTDRVTGTIETELARTNSRLGALSISRLPASQLARTRLTSRQNQGPRMQASDGWLARAHWLKKHK